MDGRSLMLPRGVTISNHDNFSIWETVVYAGIRSQNKALVGGICCIFASYITDVCFPKL
jgi:hypothetical protein